MVSAGSFKLAYGLPIACAVALVCMLSAGCRAERHANNNLGSPDGGGGQDGLDTSVVWASWPMPSPPSTTLPNPARYSMTGAGSVLDLVTGLEWQRDVDPGNYVWADANAYCARLSLAGHADWRLPARIELTSIVDWTHSMPAADPTAFPNMPPDWFWTSSRSAESPSTAWYVYFYFGYPKTDEMTNPFRVRCVRSATSGSPASMPKYAIAADSVHDLSTGLVWQRALPADTFDFASAQAYCAQLALGPAGTWRVPSMAELLTLVDERRTNPIIDATAFPNTPSESFWSSSLFADTPAMAWHVYFDYGNALYGLLDGKYHVRCVQ